MASERLTRRSFLIRGGAVGVAVLLGGCDRWSSNTSDFRKDVLDRVDELTEGAQRLVMRDTSLAREIQRLLLLRRLRRDPFRPDPLL